jgi:hypothetical protein
MLPANGVKGDGFYHRRGHRRTLQVILRTHGLNGKRLQAFFHGRWVGTMRVRQGRAHMLRDTANGQRVPLVHNYDRIKIKKRKPDAHGGRQYINSGSFYYCNTFRNGCWR